MPRKKLERRLEDTTVENVLNRNGYSLRNGKIYIGPTGSKTLNSQSVLHLRTELERLKFTEQEVDVIEINFSNLYPESLDNFISPITDESIRTALYEANQRFKSNRYDQTEIRRIIPDYVAPRLTTESSSSSNPTQQQPRRPRPRKKRRLNPNK